MRSLPAKMKEIKSEMKVVEWPHYISNCKSMGVFPKAQGQLTSHSVVNSDRNSNSVKSLWLSVLPERMKKI